LSTMSSSSHHHHGKHSSKDKDKDLEKQLARHFKKFDRDGSGKLEGKEVKAFLDSLAVSSDSETRRAFVKKFDKNHDAKLSFREFVAIVKEVKKKKHSKKDELKHTFQKFDKDRSGTIEGAELKSLVKHLAETSGFKSRKAVLATFDQNHDGKLSYTEFSELIHAAEEDHKAAKIAGRAFKKFDADKSGKIEPKEFAKFLEYLRLATNGEQRLKLQKSLGDAKGAFDEDSFKQIYVTSVRAARKREHEVKKAFRAADKDHSGELDRREVAHILPKLGIDISSDDLKKKLKSADADGDGQLDLKEFRELLFHLQDSY